MNLDKNYKTNTLIFWLAVLSISFLLLSCKSKKKITERERTKTETASNNQVNQLQNNDIHITSDTQIGSGTITISNIKEIELKQNDSAKTITITNEAGKTLSFKGADVKIKTHTSKETKQDTTAQKLSINDKSKIAKNTSNQKSEKTESQKRNSNVDLTTTSTWLWVFLIIVAVVLIYFNRKRFII